MILDETFDIAVEVLLHLSVEDAKRANKVCKMWKEALQDPKIFKAWSRRCHEWENEEAMEKSALTYGDSEIDLLWFPGVNASLIEWNPIWLYENIHWGVDTTLLGILHNREKQHALVSEASRQSKECESIHGDTKGLRAHRNHCHLVDCAISKWLNHMKAGLPNHADDGANQEDLESTAGGKWSLPASGSGTISVAQPLPQARAKPFLTTMGSPDETQSTIQTDFASGPMESPRETFCCRFMTEPGDVPCQDTHSDSAPPPLCRDKIRPEYDWMAGSLRIGHKPTISRILNFDDPSHKLQIRSEQRISTDQTAKFSEVSMERNNRKQYPNSEFSSEDSWTLSAYRSDSAESSRAHDNESLEGSTWHSSFGHLPLMNGENAAGEPLSAIFKELQLLSKGYLVTKYVDLLGIHNNPVSHGPRMSKSDSFVQKVVSQVEYNNVEIRVTQSFGWQQNSSQQWQDHHMPNYGLIGANPPGALDPELARENGRVTVTQVEKRYNAVYAVSMRHNGSCSQASENHAALSSSWRQVLFMSEHTGEQFTPSETLRLDNESLDILRSAWGLISFDDASIVILCILLGGKQPVQMTAVLTRLFGILDSKSDCATTSSHKTLPTPGKARTIKISNLQQGTSDLDEINHQDLLPWHEHCLTMELFSGLPKLVCMNDKSLLDEILWVEALALQQDDELSPRRGQ